MPRPALGFSGFSLLLLSSLGVAVACSSAGSGGPGGADKSEKNAAQPRFGNTAGAAAAGAAKAGCQQDPSFYDVPGDGCDNDADGTVDNPTACDPSSGGQSGEDFARAIGICTVASEKGFGLVSATFTRGFQIDSAPNDAQHGTLPKFGTLQPREGSLIGVLSTGYAQEYDGRDGEPFTPGKTWNTDGALPPGFPKAAGDCPQSKRVHDVVDLKLELKAPANATGFKFDFNFHSSEWPDFICSEYNDGFVAFLSATGFNGGVADNMSFDAKNNPVSVNNGFFNRCTPNTTTGCQGDSEFPSACAGGPDELSGTGFGLLDEACFSGKPATQGGATGWLSSQAPVTPGETITLELMLWDTGDGRFDSTVLLDAFQWIGGAAVTTGTERAPAPK